MGRTEKRLVYCDSQAGILRTYRQLSYHCDIRNKCIVEILRIKKKTAVVTVLTMVLMENLMANILKLLVIKRT